MNKFIYSCLIILLIFSSGCHHASTDSFMASEISVTTAMTDVEDDMNLVLQEYNHLLQPILDYSVFHQINQFSGQVVLWASTKNEADITDIQMLYYDLTRTLNPMMQTMELSGYGFKADWDLLTQQVNHMHHQLDQVMAAVEDGDVGRAVSLQNVDGQTDLLKTALVIERKISTALDRLSIEQSVVTVTEEEAIHKANLFALAQYNCVEPPLERVPDFHIIDDMGKYYEFSIPGLPNERILIHAATCGVVHYHDGFYNFIPDDQIPAEQGYPVISENEALSIVESYVTLLDGQSIQDGAIRVIDGREYYLFTINNEFSVDDAYCVDAVTGRLYQCDEALTLTPVIDN